jgi:ribosomal-protein-alanine N-acetyltransferase
MQRNTEIVAWCVLQIVLDEVSLLNIAVLPSMRRHGLARQLLAYAFNDARRRGCVRCFLEVRAGNVSAIALYQKLGFVFDGVRRNYYPASGADNAREDAHLFHADW